VAVICLIALYLGFSQYLSQFISVQLIVVALVTILAIVSITFIACYLPSKHYINRPVIHSLNNQE
ncbi:hypothetical protein, partial [Thalassotalea profundi]|uniref:hypothetical protein n=1 Tax=Thalassotalea profundi TaxID=2036687 RepID=UPI0016778A88